MIKLENTPNDIGITIKGDYDDLNGLYDAIYHMSDLYFSLVSDIISDDDDYSETKKQELLMKFEEIQNCVLSLCYDIRHAYQGDREIEYVGYDKNKYYSVNILYPWMIYYFMFFIFVLHKDFDEDDFSLLAYPYTMIDYQKHQSQLNSFIADVWQCLVAFIGKTKIMNLYDIASEKDPTIIYDWTYVEVFCFYYCDKKKKGKIVHKNMLYAFICECLKCQNLNDYQQVTSKIKKTTHREFLSFDKFKNDYWALKDINDDTFEALEMSYGDVDWNNLKF